MKLPGITWQAQRNFDYIFSLVPQHKDLELIRTWSDGREGLGLLIAVTDGESCLYYIADSKILQQLKARSLIGADAFQEGRNILNHIEPIQESLLKTFYDTCLIYDIAQAIPHWQSDGHISTVYPVMTGVTHNYGFEEISAELLHHKYEDLSGPYKPIPQTTTGPLSLSDLFGVRRLENT